MYTETSTEMYTEMDTLQPSIPNITNPVDIANTTQSELFKFLLDGARKFPQISKELTRDQASKNLIKEEKRHSIRREETLNDLGLWLLDIAREYIQQEPAELLTYPGWERLGNMGTEPPHGDHVVGLRKGGKQSKQDYQAKAKTPWKSSQLGSFTKFIDLPGEMRQAIWRFAANPPNAVNHIATDIHVDADQFRLKLSLYEDPLHQWKKDNRKTKKSAYYSRATLAAVCRESRYYVEKEAPYRLPTLGNRGFLRLNPLKDIMLLHFPDSSHTMLQSFMNVNGHDSDTWNRYSIAGAGHDGEGTDKPNLRSLLRNTTRIGIETPYMLRKTLNHHGFYAASFNQSYLSAPQIWNDQTRHASRAALDTLYGWFITAFLHPTIARLESPSRFGYTGESKIQREYFINTKAIPRSDTPLNSNASIQYKKHIRNVDKGPFGHPIVHSIVAGTDIVSHPIIRPNQPSKTYYPILHLCDSAPMSAKQPPDLSTADFWRFSMNKLEKDSIFWQYVRGKNFWETGGGGGEEHQLEWLHLASAGRQWYGTGGPIVDASFMLLLRGCLQVINTNDLPTTNSEFRRNELLMQGQTTIAVPYCRCPLCNQVDGCNCVF